MRRLAPTPDEYLELLRSAATPSPSKGVPTSETGQFKEDRNEAGGYLFVEPSLVNGTLRQGFELTRTLTSAFARAVFQMFVVFGSAPIRRRKRTRRPDHQVNAELVAAGEHRIIIPGVYRNNYMMGLRGMSTNANEMA